MTVSTSNAFNSHVWLCQLELAGAVVMRATLRMKAGSNVKTANNLSLRWAEPILSV